MISVCRFPDIQREVQLKVKSIKWNEAVLEVLPALSYEGVTGAIAFDENKDAIRDSAFVKECNTETGVWDFVTVATVG